MITGPEPGLTRDSIGVDFTWQGQPMRLFDTAGLRRKSRIQEKAEKLSASDTVRALRFAEVVVLLIDGERPFEHQDLTIGQMVADEGRALVIAVNKWDLIEDKQRAIKDLRETVAEKLAQVPGVELIMVSALAERGLDKLMAAIMRAHEIWNRRVPTAALNEWLRSALDRHPPPAVRGRRVRIRYMTQPSTRPANVHCVRLDAGQNCQNHTCAISRTVCARRLIFQGPRCALNLRKGGNPYDRD